MNAPSENLQRPLALLASLPASDAAALLERLPTSSILRLLQALPDVPHVPCQLPDKVARDMAQELATPTAEKANAGNRPTDRYYLNPEQLLATVDAAAVAPLLDAELPQTVAAVLRRMPVAVAASVLARLSSPSQLAVIRRLAMVQGADHVALSQVCQAVAEQAMRAAAQPLQPKSGVVMVARLLDQLDRATDRALMENLAQEDPLVCARVRLVRSLLAQLRATRFVAERQAA